MAFHFDISRREMERLGFDIVGVPYERVQGHDDPRGTESALRAMQLCDSLLERMRIVHIANSFHRDDMFTINANERKQTRVYGEMDDLPLILGVFRLEDHGAGAAAALAATQLRALKTMLGPDVVK
jgi:hypothetical protein